MHKIEIEILAQAFVEAIQSRAIENISLTSLILEKVARSNRVADFEIAVFERLKRDKKPLSNVEKQQATAP